MDNSFNIWVSPDPSLTNGYSKFTVQLPNPLFFNTDWKVGLTSISFPSKIKCLPNAENSLVLVLHDTEVESGYDRYDLYYFEIENNFCSEETLITYLNKLFAVHSVSLVINEDRKVSVKSSKKGKIAASYILGGILGMDDNGVETEILVHHFDANKDNVTPNKIDCDFMKAAYYLIYTDIIKPSVMSGKYANILKYIPVKNIPNKTLQNYSHNIKNIELHELSTLMISEISVEIRTHSGFLPIFANNEIVLNLLFTCEK